MIHCIAGVKFKWRSHYNLIYYSFWLQLLRWHDFICVRWIRWFLQGCLVSCLDDWVNDPFSIMLLWHGNAFHITDLLWGESTNHILIPLIRGTTVVFWWFFVFSVNKLLKIQPGWWCFETPWCLCDDSVMNKYHLIHFGTYKMDNIRKKKKLNAFASLIMLIQFSIQEYCKFAEQW